MSALSPSERIEIIYVYDPLCGWCYAFNGELQKIKSYITKQSLDSARALRWKSLAGGMVTGSRVRPIREIAPYLLQAIPRLEEHTGVKMGQRFLEGVLREGSMELSSEPPSRVIVALRHLLEEHDYHIIHSLQEKLYQEGRDIQQHEVLVELLDQLGVEHQQFFMLYESDAVKQEVQQEFEKTAALGISGFPCLIGIKDDQTVLLAQGWKQAQQVTRRVEHWLTSLPLAPSLKTQELRA